jgi:hypothetical protein
MRFDALQAELNRYPSERVLECLHGLHEHPPRSRVKSTPPPPRCGSQRAFGASTQSGVWIDSSSPGKFLLRVSVFQRGHRFYDELEGSEASTIGVVRALLAKLHERGVEPMESGK